MGALALGVVAIGPPVAARRAGDQPPVQASESPTPSPTPTVRPGHCAGYGEKLAPATAYLGDAVPITLTFRTLCAGYVPFTHIVLVLDGSASMAGQPSRQIREAAEALVRWFDLANRPDYRVGTVEFDTRTRRLCNLTNDESRLIACIGRLEASGGKSIEAGINEGVRTLIRGRRGEDRDLGIREIMIVFTDGRNDGGCQVAIRAANQAKSQGVLMITVCSGADCDDDCLEDLATSPRYTLDVTQAAVLTQIFESMHSDYWLSLRSLVVTDRLPARTRYVGSSAYPTPTLVSAAHDLVAWHAAYVPSEGLTFTFRVLPVELGLQAVNVDARAVFTSNRGIAATLVYPIPQVLVLPRPSPTPTPAATATPTATATPAPTATPRPPQRLYLPTLRNDG